MDISSIMTALLSDESVKSLGKKSGVSDEMVENILESALPMLLKGANEQANNKKTAESFAGALMQHAKSDTSDLSTFMDGVDLEDGIGRGKRLNQKAAAPSAEDRNGA